VSSVVDGYGEFRKAARAGITAAGGEPVLVNEDFPALSSSPRNACLDGVASCDGLLLLVGARGGWKTPSGRLVVEEECEEARRRRLPMLLFVEETTRDPEATQLAATLSDYVAGSFRTGFTTPAELAAAVEASVLEEVSRMSVPQRAFSELEAALLAKNEIHQQAVLRLVVAPEREGDLITPMKLESPDFKRLVYEIGHGESGLLHYEMEKEASYEGPRLVVRQHRTGAAAPREAVVLAIAEDGTVRIDTNVTGSSRASSGLIDSFVVREEVLEEVLFAGFRFVRALVHRMDPYQRHQRFVYGAALLQMNFRSIERNPKERQGFSMRGLDAREPIHAHDAPRPIQRDEMAAPSDEVARTIIQFKRRLE